MPVYEYECLKCGGRIGEIQKFSDRPLAKHNGCGGRLKRVLSAPAFQFKGTGWYVTDYARKGASGNTDDKKDDKKDDRKDDKKPKAEAKAAESADSGSKPAKKETKT